MPRRFSRCFQIAHGASLEQEARVRELLAAYQRFERFDRVLFALDRARNRVGRHFIPIVFSDSLRGLGSATPATIYLSSALTPAGGIERVLMHELGHSVGWNLLAPIDRSEGWAEEFWIWCAAGAADDQVWERIELA